MNLRPSAPKADALPNCATPRIFLLCCLCCFCCSLGLLCSPPCGAQIFLRLGAPEKFDRCASFCSLLLPPAALAKLTQSRCATKLRYASRCFFHAKRVYLILKLLSTDFSCGSFLNCFTQKFTFLIDFIFIGVYNEICKLIER